MLSFPCFSLMAFTFRFAIIYAAYKFFTSFGWNRNLAPTFSPFQVRDGKRFITRYFSDESIFTHTSIDGTILNQSSMCISSSLDTSNHLSPISFILFHRVTVKSWAVKRFGSSKNQRNALIAVVFPLLFAPTKIV